MLRLKLVVFGVLLFGAVSGCLSDVCPQASARWREPGIFAAAESDQTTSAEPGLPLADTWIQERWPRATVESITWLPETTEERFSEPGQGLDFRDEPVLQLFASREEYGIRPGWPHSYPYGPRIDTPDQPFLVVVMIESQTPSNLEGVITDFLEQLDVPEQSHDEILAHLQSHKEKHTAVRNTTTGNTTWKYGYWAPIANLPPLDPFLDSLPAEHRVQSRWVGWTEIVYDPHWQINLDQPTRTIAVPSTIGTVDVRVDGSDFVQATSPLHYAANDSAFRSTLRDAFQDAGLPTGRIDDAEIRRTESC